MSKGVSQLKFVNGTINSSCHSNHMDCYCKYIYFACQLEQEK